MYEHREDGKERVIFCTRFGFCVIGTCRRMRTNWYRYTRIDRTHEICHSVYNRGNPEHIHTSRHERVRSLENESRTFTSDNSSLQNRITFSRGSRECCQHKTNPHSEIDMSYFEALSAKKDEASKKRSSVVIGLGHQDILPNTTPRRAQAISAVVNDSRSGGKIHVYGLYPSAACTRQESCWC